MESARMVLMHSWSSSALVSLVGVDALIFRLPALLSFGFPVRAIIPKSGLRRKPDREGGRISDKGKRVDERPAVAVLHQPFIRVRPTPSLTVGLLPYLICIAPTARAA